MAGTAHEGRIALHGLIKPPKAMNQDMEASLVFGVRNQVIKQIQRFAILCPHTVERRTPMIEQLCQHFGYWEPQVRWAKRKAGAIAQAASPSPASKAAMAAMQRVQKRKEAAEAAEEAALAALTGKKRTRDSGEEDADSIPSSQPRPPSRRRINYVGRHRIDSQTPKGFVTVFSMLDAWKLDTVVPLLIKAWKAEAKTLINEIVGRMPTTNATITFIQAQEAKAEQELRDIHPVVHEDVIRSLNRFKVFSSWTDLSTSEGKLRSFLAECLLDTETVIMYIACLVTWIALIPRSKDTTKALIGYMSTFGGPWTGALPLLTMFRLMMSWVPTSARAKTSCQRVMEKLAVLPRWMSKAPKTSLCIYTGEAITAFIGNFEGFSKIRGQVWTYLTVEPNTQVSLLCESLNSHSSPTLAREEVTISSPWVIFGVSQRCFLLTIAKTLADANVHFGYLPMGTTLQGGEVIRILSRWMNHEALEKIRWPTAKSGGGVDGQEGPLRLFMNRQAALKKRFFDLVPVYTAHKMEGERGRSAIVMEQRIGHLSSSEGVSINENFIPRSSAQSKLVMGRLVPFHAHPSVTRCVEVVVTDRSIKWWMPVQHTRWKVKLSLGIPTLTLNRLAVLMLATRSACVPWRIPHIKTRRGLLEEAKLALWPDTPLFLSTHTAKTVRWSPLCLLHSLGAEAIVLQQAGWHLFDTYRPTPVGGNDVCDLLVKCMTMIVGPKVRGILHHFAEVDLTPRAFTSWGVGGMEAELVLPSHESIPLAFLNTARGSIQGLTPRFHIISRWQTRMTNQWMHMPTSVVVTEGTMSLLMQGRIVDDVSHISATPPVEDQGPFMRQTSSEEEDEDDDDEDEADGADDMEEDGSISGAISSTTTVGSTIKTRRFFGRSFVMDASILMPHSAVAMME